MAQTKSAQTIIAPLATLLTTFLWLETWLEILSRGTYHSPDDLSKVYLATMGAYAGAAEISKWLTNEPTVAGEDPRFERIQRGGLFVWLWLTPLLFAYGWRITNPAVIMPGPLQKIVLGLIGIFFLKAASRRWRHKKHGVLDPVTGQVKDDTDDDGPEETDLTETVFKMVEAKPDGISASEILTALPTISRPRLYRALDELIKARRLSRTGKPRTADVRYRIVTK